MGDYYGQNVNHLHSIACDATNVTFDVVDGYGPYEQGVGWDIFLSQLLAAFGALIVCSLGSLISAPLCAREMKKRGKYYDFVTTYMGLEPEAPEKPFANGLLYTIQMLTSTVSVICWIYKSYEHCATPDAVYTLEIFLAGGYVVLFIWNGLRNGCAISYVFSLSGVVDIFTVAPVVARIWTRISWLDLGYLRAVRVLQAFSRLVDSGLMRDTTEFQRSMISALLRTVSMVVIMAASAFLLEVIGEIPNFVDAPVETKMGPISFYQCIYWVFTTISTVGYGDFSPTTIPARLLAIFCIVGGVIFFSTECAEIVHIQFLMANGQGNYSPSARNVDHVVVLGGAVTHYSDLLHDFLKEFLHPEHNDHTDVVLMSTAMPDPELQRRLKESWMENRVIYLVGSALDPDDVARARLDTAKMAFILGDTNTGEPDWEDEQNIVTAVATMRAAPHSKLRLLLLRPENRELAMRVGIRRHFCYAVNELKVNLMSQSCRCPGWSTLLLNLAESSTLSHKDPTHGLTPDDIGMSTTGWNAQFCWGESYEILGCCINNRYVGTTFNTAVLEIMEQHNVILLAVQVEGRLMCGPLEYTLKDGDIIFCIAQSEEHLDPVKQVMAQGASWSDGYRSNRNKVHPADKIQNRKKFEDERKFQVQDRFDQQSNDFKTKGGVTKLKAVSAATMAIGAMNFGSRAAPPPPNNEIAQKSPPLRSVSPTAMRSISRTGNGDSDSEDEDKINVVKPRQQRAKAKKTQLQPHIVLLGATTGLWQQTIAFLRPLREKYLARHFPVIVIMPEACPQHIATIDGFEDIAFLEAHPMKAGTIDTWIDPKTTTKVIMLGGRPGTSDSRMVDSKNVIIANSIEEFLDIEGAQIMTHDCFLFYEIFNPENERLLARLDRAWMQKVVTTAPHSDDVKYSWRYSCGALLFPASIGSLVAMGYYTPGIMEMFEAMCIPARREQVAMPWRVRVPPEYYGKAYRELARALLSGEFGVTHASSQVKELRNSTSLKASDVVDEEAPAAAAGSAMPFATRARVGTDGAKNSRRISLGTSNHLQGNVEALPLGLFRAPGRNGSLLGYVFTAPPPSTEILEGDFVYCTAPPTFGHAVVGMLG